MDASSVTIVVVPRERFSAAPDALECLYRNTPAPFNLIYVDANSPRPIKRHLEREAANKGFRLVRIDEYLAPNQARNIGLHLTDTKYVVFVDNDLFVSPGWLDALVACADETGAWLVGPLYCMGEPLHETIHMAGGYVHIEDTAGRRVLKEGHFLGHVPIAAARPELRRKECELVEFHTLLARTDELKRLGGMDPALLSAPEHVDLCLVVLEAGGTIYFEPSSIVTYVWPTNLSFGDLRYYLLRWSTEWHRSSLRHFQAKWRLEDDDPFLSEHFEWLECRRTDAWRQWRVRLHRVFGAALGSQIETRIEHLLMGRPPDAGTLTALHAL